MANNDADIILQARIDQSSEAVDKLKGDVGRIQKKLDSSKVSLQSKLDTSKETIDRLKQDVEKIEKRLKSTKIKLEVGLDKTKINELKKQLESLQDGTQKTGRSNSFKTGIQQSLEDAEKLSETMQNLEKNSAFLSSRKTITNDETGNMTKEIKTYNNSLLETKKIITSFDVNKNPLSTMVEDTKNYGQAQKQIYSEMNKLQNEIFSIDKQVLKSNGDNQDSLIQQRNARQELLKQAESVIQQYGLESEKLQEQLDYSKQLKDIQLSIAKEKGKETQSNKAYTEMIRLTKEEYQIKNNMVGLDGEALALQTQKLNLVRNAQESVNELIGSESGSLFNQEKHNRLLQEREKLKINLLSKENQLEQKEADRIKKLNEKVSDVDFSQLDFYNEHQLREYVTAMAGADAQVTKFSRSVDSAGNEMARMTVQTKNGKNEIKEAQIAIDKKTSSMYKLGEATKLNSNRMLGMVQQMSEAIKKSVTWAISMGLLYGSLRNLKDGIQVVSDLDKELIQVAITTGMTKEQTKELALEYVELGKQMGKTVAEISKVNTELVRQGLSAEESMNRMQTVLKLSASGGIDTAQTLSVITSSVNALGENAETTADVLLKAGQISASSAEEVGEALQRTASSAKSTGMTLEQLGALISTLVEVTQESPSSLGNSLKTLLARFNQIDEITGELNQDFNKVQKAFESVGIAFTDSAGQIRPLYELLQELSLQWGDLDKNTKSYFATTSAGKQFLMPEHMVTYVENSTISVKLLAC